MELFILVSRDDIAERWNRALKRDLQRLALDADPGLVGDSVCIVHWESLSVAQQERLLGLHHRLRLIVLTDQPRVELGRRLIRQGARGFGNTFVTDSLLQEMVKAVERGDIWAGAEVLQSVLRQLLDQVDPPSLALGERFGLSEREREVLGEVMTGASNKVVARRLNITERTVKAHMSAILSKTGAHDRVELILLAQQAEQKAV